MNADSVATGSDMVYYAGVEPDLGADAG